MNKIILKAWETVKNKKNEKKEIEFLESRGWHTWYNKDYWVHPKTVIDPSRQDYTNYGMPRSEAMAYETKGRKPFQVSLLGGLFGSGAMQNNFNRKK